MVKIIEATDKKSIKDFIKFPIRLYKDDPFYAPQLTHDLLKDFSPINPLFKHTHARYYLATNEKDVIIGRIASIINKRHIEFHQENAGFFGFLDCVNDSEVASALLNRAKDDLKGAGLEIMRGPMNFSTNEECGFLLEGYDTPPMLMTPYNPPYYHDLMSVTGFQKAKELYGYIVDIPENLPEKVIRVANIAEKRGITVKAFDKNKFDEHLEAFKEVYNSAWEKNWGFIPLTDNELNYLGKKLKPIVVPDMSVIAYHNDLPVGFIGIFPDFNIVLRQMKGSLNPLSIIKAIIYYKKIRQGRLLLLGAKKEYRNKGIDGILFREAFKGVKRLKYNKVEFSWVLEDNYAVRQLTDMIGGKLYKKYRIYEKNI